MSSEKALEALEGEVIPRDEKGQFPQGVSGNPKGRPKGSKNKITLLKLDLEEAVRESNQERLRLVLDLIITAAIEGDKDARKMVWDACMSKSSVAEDKSAGTKQQITVHRMEVTQEKSDGGQE